MATEHEHNASATGATRGTTRGTTLDLFADHEDTSVDKELNANADTVDKTAADTPVTANVDARTVSNVAASADKDTGAKVDTNAEWTVVDDHDAAQRNDAGQHAQASGFSAQFQINFGSLPTGEPKVPRGRPSWRFMLSHPAHLFSLGFGSGLSPIMPGTFGTLFGWLSFAVLNPYLSQTAWLALIAVGFVVGIWLCGFTAKKMGTPDPGSVVWDEIIAIWIVLLFVMPTGFKGQLGAFLVFRFFDMVKPPPIRYFDRHLKGGFGIMFDDIVAAFFSLIVIALWR